MYILLYQSEVLRQILSEYGFSSDPEKVAAILQILEPTNVSELCIFLWMVNHLAKFTPYLADDETFARSFVKNKDWCWEPSQKEAFEKVKVKKAVTTSPVQC